MGPLRPFMSGILFALFCCWVHPGSARAEEEAVEEPPPMGTLRVYTIPRNAKVFLDGNPVQNFTPLAMEVEPGVHEIRVVMDGYFEQTRSIVARAGWTKDVWIFLKAVPEHEIEDRQESFRGGYLQLGAANFQLLCTDIMLGSTFSEAQYPLREMDGDYGGLAIQLRYVHPLEEWGFLIVDTGYSDARIRLHETPFPDPQGEVWEIDLLVLRGGIDFSIGPNLSNHFLPYLGGGIHYTVIQDEDKAGWLGSDFQEDFMGFTAKAGLLWNSRAHLTVSAEYQYHWAYEMEDQTIIGLLGYQY